jgi:uracil phosphoribosyltransferase
MCVHVGSGLRAVAKSVRIGKILIQRDEKTAQAKVRVLISSGWAGERASVVPPSLSC